MRLIPCAALFAASIARADDPTDISGLLEESVVSTASDSLETARTAPALSTVITAEQLRRFGIRSISEAITFFATGMRTENPHDDPAELNSRGLVCTQDFGKHMLLLLNGHTMNDQAGGWSTIDFAAGIPLGIVDHIEVILGPGSVLYGSNAMFGVINVITKEAKDYAGVKVAAEGGLLVPAKSRNPTNDIGGFGRASVGAGYKFNLFNTPGEVTTEIEYAKQAGPSYSYGPQSVPGANFGPYSMAPSVWGGDMHRSTFYDVPAGIARVSIGDFTLMVQGQSSRRGLPTDASYFDGASFNRTSSGLFDARYRFAPTSIVSVRARVYGDLYYFDQTLYSSTPSECDPGETNGCRGIFNMSSKWIGSEIQTTFDWTRHGNLTTLIGVDGRIRHLSSDSYVVDSQTMKAGPQQGVFSFFDEMGAIYLQQIYRPLRQLEFNAGARVDAYSLYPAHVSPRAAITAQPWSQGTVKVIYSEAFRAPSAYEMFRTSRFRIPPDHLSPEIVRSVEASVQQRFGAQRVMIGVYRSWWSQMVQLAQITSSGREEERIVNEARERGLITEAQGTVANPIYQYQNSGTIDNYGLNSSFDGVVLNGLQKLQYGASLTWSFSRNTWDRTQYRVPVSSPLFGNARLSYDFSGNYPTIAAAVAITSKRLANRGDVAGFTPVPFAPIRAQLRLAVTGPIAPIPGLSYHIAGSYTFGDREPYVVGPIQAIPYNAPPTAAELAPATKLSMFAGLQYEFGAQQL